MKIRLLYHYSIFKAHKCSTKFVTLHCQCRTTALTLLFLHWKPPITAIYFCNYFQCPIKNQLHFSLFTGLKKHSLLTTSKLSVKSCQRIL